MDWMDGSSDIECDIEWIKNLLLFIIFTLLYMITDCITDIQPIWFTQWTIREAINYLF